MINNGATNDAINNKTEADVADVVDIENLETDFDFAGRFDEEMVDY